MGRGKERRGGMRPERCDLGLGLKEFVEPSADVGLLIFERSSLFSFHRNKLSNQI
jgi:hypothetical protein